MVGQGVALSGLRSRVRRKKNVEVKNESSVSFTEPLAFFFGFFLLSHALPGCFL